MTYEGSISYTYDNNGNQTTKTQSAQTTTYEYDYDNQLKKITYPGSTTNTFKYDGDRRRIEKVDSTGTKRYIWDGINPICEMDGSNNITDIYVYGLGRQVVYRKSGANSYFYHHDGLGSVVNITDSSGNTQNTYQYDDFGNITSQTENITNDYKYTGKPLDNNSGLYYYGARYYNPTAGRFVSKDPIGLAGGINFYAYVINNPLMFIDAWGLDGELVMPRPPDAEVSLSVMPDKNISDSTESGNVAPDHDANLGWGIRTTGVGLALIVAGAYAAPGTGGYFIGVGIALTIGGTSMIIQSLRQPKGGEPGKRCGK